MFYFRTILSINFLLICSCVQAHTILNSWQNFAEPYSRKSASPAVIVYGTVDGIKCKFQIDTGLDFPYRWNQRVESTSKFTNSTIEVLGISEQLSISNITLDQVHSPNGCVAIGNIASLGNGFFESGTIELDLKHSRMRFFKKAVLQNAKNSQPFFYARWGDDSVGGHALVEIANAGSVVGYALLDTGVPMAFSTFSNDDFKLWTDDFSDALKERLVSSWGRTHSCTVASIKVGSPYAAARSLYGGEVSFCPNLNFKTPIKLAGIIGLQAFDNCYLYIDFLSKRISWRDEN